MKHAGSATLYALEPLLTRLRAIPGLVERTPGSFYLKSRAYLHFHEDPTGTFADVKLDQVSFERLPVTTRTQQLRLLRQVIASLAS
jgi:hypothetical protein